MLQYTKENLAYILRRHLGNNDLKSQASRPLCGWSWNKGMILIPAPSASPSPQSSGKRDLVQYLKAEKMNIYI